MAFLHPTRMLLGALAAALLALAVLPSLRAKDGDWEQWTELSWTQPLGSGLDLGLRWEGRWEKDLSRFAYSEVEPMLAWRWSPRWDFGVGYERDERLRPAEEVAHVPSLSAVLKVPRLPLGTLEGHLSNRFRMDFMVPEDASVEWTPVYRNRTDWEGRWKLGSRELVPFVFEETFVDLRAGRFIQNRAGVGLGVPLASHWMARLYWMRLDEKFAGGWEWHPVIGVQVQAQF